MVYIKLIFVIEKRKLYARDKSFAIQDTKFILATKNSLFGMKVLYPGKKVESIGLEVIYLGTQITHFSISYLQI
jgi:hypothetical protein